MSAWSRHHDQCQGCGRSDRPHYARGLCKACFNRPYLARYRRRLSAAFQGPSERARRLQAPYRQSAALVAFHHRRLAERGQ